MSKYFILNKNQNSQTMQEMLNNKEYCEQLERMSILSLVNNLRIIKEYLTKDFVYDIACDHYDIHQEEISSVFGVGKSEFAAQTVMGVWSKI